MPQECHSVGRGHAIFKRRGTAASEKRQLQSGSGNYNLDWGAPRTPSRASCRVGAQVSPNVLLQYLYASTAPWVLMASRCWSRRCWILQRPNLALLSAYVWSSAALALGHVPASAQSTWRRVPAPRVPQPSAGRRRAASFDREQYQTSTLAEYMESIWFFVATSSSSDASSSNKKTWSQLAVFQQSAHTLRHPGVTQGDGRKEMGASTRHELTSGAVYSCVPVAVAMTLLYPCVSLRVKHKCPHNLAASTLAHTLPFAWHLCGMVLQVKIHGS